MGTDAAVVMTQPPVNNSHADLPTYLHKRTRSVRRLRRVSGMNTLNHIDITNNYNNSRIIYNILLRTVVVATYLNA